MSLRKKSNSKSYSAIAQLDRVVTLMTSNSTKTVLVVIVNYKTPKLTVDCLQALANEVSALPDTKVIVVDNNSGDRSVEQITTAIKTQNWSDWITVAIAERNGGYAYGNNLAIRPALESPAPPDYILLLNPDTVPRPAALATLVNFLERHQEVGIAGSRLEDPDGTPQISAFRFHSFLSELDGGLRLGIVSKLLSNWLVAPPVSDVATQTDWVAGASMLIRREVFESVGWLDEEYFMYYEEVDFCLQAKKAGWSCWYVPESRVVHLVGQSSGVTNTKIPPKRLPQYWFDSRRRYFLKNHGWLYAALADFLWLFGFAIWKGRRLVQRKPDNDPPYLLKDFFRNTILGKN
jgi:N-acetylglucosaminyl-diphospho-decaprenol L-rhamnosyltransferase